MGKIAKRDHYNHVAVSAREKKKKTSKRDFNIRLCDGPSVSKTIPIPIFYFSRTSNTAKMCCNW